MVLALAAFDEHGNAAAAAGAEAITAQLHLATGTGGAADGVPLEVRARPHGGFGISAVLTTACDFEV